MKKRMIAIVMALMLIVGEFSMLGIIGHANSNIILNNSPESIVLDNDITENVSSNCISDNNTFDSSSDNNVSCNDILGSVSKNDILENISDNDCFDNDIQGNISENNITDSVSTNEVSENDIWDNVSENVVSENAIHEKNLPSTDIFGNDILSSTASENNILTENTILNEQVSTDGESSSATATKEVDLTKVPSRPEFGYGSANNQTIKLRQATVSLSMKAENKCKIYYTLDGKNPTFKMGLPSENAQLYSNEIKVGNKAKVVVKAIAVNGAGLCSAVTTHTFMFKPEATKIVLSAKGSVTSTNKDTGVTTITVNLVKGKNLQLVTSYTPNYAVNKVLIWEIVSKPENAGNGVKLSNDGKIVTTSNAVEGTYKVKATLKCNTAVSATILVNVKNQANIKSLTVTQKKITLTTKGNRSASKNLFKYVSSKASKEIKATNLIWESSDISVATVTKEGVVESVVGNKGKAVITATAKDGSGKQVKFTVTVKQLATKVTISGENKLGKGNNIVLKAVVAPKSAASQKVGWEITKYPDKADKSQVKINANGKLSATKTATIGSYTIKATTLDGSNQSVTHVVTIQEAVKLVDIKEENYTLYRVSGGETINARTAKNITVTCKTTLDKDSTNLEVLNTAPGIVDATYDATNKRIKISATGAGTGTATITVKAKAGSKKKDTIKVKVVNPPSSVTIQLPNGSTGDLVINHNHKPKVVLGTKYGKPEKIKVNWTLAKANENVVLNSSSGSLKIKNTASAGDTFTLKAEVIGDLTLNNKIVCTAKKKIKKLELYLARERMKGEPVIYVDDEPKSIDVRVQQLGTADMILLSNSTLETTKNIEVIVKPSGLNLTYNAKNGTGKLQCIEPGKYTLTIKALDGTGISKTYKIRGMKRE